ncbi:MAG: DNA mismatch repair protein MutS [Oscillochloridaceae bacterium umkhey_bin13]
MPRIELHAWYRQYRKLKDQAADAILLFRFGDFYETFDDDAKLIAELLDVTLTRKDYAVDKTKPKEAQKLYAPMAGMPYHAVERYVVDLVGRGYRVAIAEQLTETEASRNDTRPRSVFAAGLQQAPPSELERKMVHREIVRVITPGTVVDSAMLTAHANTYLVATLVDDAAVGLAYADLSTGEFACAEFRGPRAITELQGELARLQAAEILVPDDAALRLPDLAPAQARLASDLAPLTKDERELLLPHERVARRLDATSEARWTRGHVTAWPTWRWDPREAHEALLRQLKVASLAAFGLDARPLAARAAGALIQYVHETQRQRAEQLSSLRVYATGSFMLLDPQTRRNLELLEPSRQGSKTSLVHVLDRTRTPMGARLLRRWIAQPLITLAPLQARQAAVALLVDDAVLRAELREALGSVGDLERALNRVAQGATMATPRDLVQLRASLRAMPAVLAAAGDRLATLLPEGETLPTPMAQTPASDPTVPDDEDLFGAADADQPANFGAVLTPSAPALLDPCADVLALLEQSLDDDPPALLGAANYLRTTDESGERPRRVIRPGFDQRMDALVRASRHAQEFIDRLEGRERERTGIKSLKVGYNSVFGYYLELSRTTDEKLIPKDYERKQTLVGAERYITAELKEYEQIIDRAKLQLGELEREAFGRICAQAAAALDRLRIAARALAQLDALASLAEAAVRGRYVRPQLDERPRLEIVAGRHPVVEQVLNDAFVPNDTTLDSDEAQLLIITGPNMAGKSTVLRQVALIVLLAQIGSFVPADQATIGLVDRIFTRIGAQDDLATGQSTFMVEMTETAALLLQSTRRSLIILDEVGRGTSTYDGMAIARAVVEYLHNAPHLGCRTLFATHYHELTALDQVLPRLRNYHMAAVERDGHVVFLHELRPGGADRSYGIHVAELAGLPPEVIRRASTLLADLEQARAPALLAATAPGEPVPPPAATPPPPPSAQLSLFDVAPSPVVTYVRRLNLNALTPLEALIKLHELQQMAGQE